MSEAEPENEGSARAPEATVASRTKAAQQCLHVAMPYSNNARVSGNAHCGVYETD